MARRDAVVLGGTSATAAAAGATQGTAAQGLTATGTTQANALPLPADASHFGTVAAGAGCILPACNAGDTGVIFNGSTNALLVYPPVGASINKGAANASYSIAAATPYADWTCIAPGLFIICQSA